MNQYAMSLLADIDFMKNREIRELVINKARVLHYKKKEKIKRDGDSISELLFCIEGVYKCIQYNSEGKEVLKFSNIGGLFSGFILNPGYDILDTNYFSGECIASTNCVVVAIPIEVVTFLYKNYEEMKQFIFSLYKTILTYYNTMTVIGNMNGLDRYNELTNFAKENWACLSNQDKALFMNMDYSYWMKIKKKYKLD